MFIWFPWVEFLPDFHYVDKPAAIVFLGTLVILAFNNHYQQLPSQYQGQSHSTITPHS